MSQPHFRVKTEDTLVDSRLSEDEIEQALKEIERLSFLEVPKADWTVTPVHTTNNEWYRQKLPGEQWRNIIVFEISEQTILLKAILYRDENTYSVVRKLYLSDE